MKSICNFNYPHRSFDPRYKKYWIQPDCWTNLKEKRVLVNNTMLSLGEVLNKQFAETCMSCRSWDLSVNQSEFILDLLGILSDNNSNVDKNFLWLTYFCFERFQFCGHLSYRKKTQGNTFSNSSLAMAPNRKTTIVNSNEIRFSGLF